jgi:Tfp pilus assembly PilM family ATPase
MQEEIDLRHSWCCLIYLTLASIGHPTRGGGIAESSIPNDIREKYSDAVERVVEAYKNEKTIPSVEELLMAAEDSNLSEIERAIRTQSLRVVTLAPVVIMESMEARQSQAPPTPPIEGAFD